jgi:hypothetical protein
VHRTGRLRARDFFGPRHVRQVQRHERLEARAFRQRGNDAFPVLERGCRRRYRRTQVRHDDGAREAPRGIGENRAHVLAVAQVHVPVVGASQGDAVHASENIIRDCVKARGSAKPARVSPPTVSSSA